MASNVRSNQKLSGKKPRGKSETLPGKAVTVKQMVNNLQSGGVVNQQLFREGEYHEDDSIPPEGDADFIDLTDAERVANEVAKAKEEKRKEEELQKKQKAQEAFDKAVNEAAEKMVSQTTTNQNDDE
jgi:hypothetical protein